MAVEINGDGLITVDGTSTTQGRVRLKEDTDNGSNYVELTAPASVTANRTITFPDDTGTVLTNSGNQTGVFSALTVNSNNISADNSLGFRNRIINGDMRIDQRNAGASVTPADNAYTLDRWKSKLSQSSKYSVQQSSVAPARFNNSLLVTSLSAYSITSTDRFGLQYPIEGFNTADFAFGTASAVTITLSFWVRSSLTGTFGGAFFNDGANRSYPFTYSISSANTWEQKTVTLTGDTTGTWKTDNTVGLYIEFSLGTGSTLSGTAGAWAGAFTPSATGATSVVGTNGATFYITGVQLEVGSVATPFERRPYGTELDLCQRYLPAFNYGTGGDRYRGAAGSTTLSYPNLQFQVQPRTPPTGITVSSASHWSIFNNANSTSGAATAITFSVAGLSNGELNVTTTAGSPTLAAGDALVLYANNSSAQILFTGCEL